MWQIRSQSLAAESVADIGNRLLIGNGYCGVRGTLDEARKASLACTHLAGHYHQVGASWREPLNAPHLFYTVIRQDNECLIPHENNVLFHEQFLDFHYGIHRRKTLFSNGLMIESERFCSLDDIHKLYQTYKITNTQADQALELITGIDCDIWELNGPHYETFEYRHQSWGKADYIRVKGIVQESNDSVYVSKKMFFSQAVDCTSQSNGFNTYKLFLEKDKSITLAVDGTLYTSQDENFEMYRLREKEERNSLFTLQDYEEALKKHCQKWQAIWDMSQVNIEGDSEAEKAMNYSIYHLNSIAPRHHKAMSIPARGLSGQTYKGAVFWDTEIFILDYFLGTDPDVAKSLIKYRIDGLKGAREKAKSYAFKGAFYAWESQDDGYEACSDYNVIDVFTGRPVKTYFKDKQIHISAAIVEAINRYILQTGDESILYEGGAEVIFECARFYDSRCSRFAYDAHWSLSDVIGPDEYHERIDNNAYTNQMAIATLKTAYQVYQKLRREADDYLQALMDKCDLAPQDAWIWHERSQQIKGIHQNEQGVIEQFDGYFDLEDIKPDKLKERLCHPKEYWGGGHGIASQTQVIKQADVITLLALKINDYSQDIRQANFDYYEPRCEHGSSLSASMHALLAFRSNRPKKAYDYFMKTATTEMRGGGKQWAGLLYIGGTHPAAAGGAYKVLLNGIVGLDLQDNNIRMSPVLPEHWKRLQLKLMIKGKIYELNLTHQQASIKEIKIND